VIGKQAPVLGALKLGEEKSKRPVRRESVDLKPHTDRNIHVKCMTCFPGKENERIMQMFLNHMSASIIAPNSERLGFKYIYFEYSRPDGATYNPNDEPVSRYFFNFSFFY